MVGFFVNTVPLRLEFGSCLNMESLLQKSQQLFLGLMARQACPFDELVSTYGFEMDLFFSLVDFVPSFSRCAPVHVPAKCKFGLELEVDLASDAEAVFTWIFDESRDNFLFGWFFPTFVFPFVFSFFHQTLFLRREFLYLLTFS
jgi:hypothetical protein